MIDSPMTPCACPLVGRGIGGPISQVMSRMPASAPGEGIAQLALGRSDPTDPRAASRANSRRVHRDLVVLLSVTIIRRHRRAGAPLRRDLAVDLLPLPERSSP